VKEKIDELKGKDDEISCCCRVNIFVFFGFFSLILFGNFIIGCIMPGDYSYIKFIKFINIFIPIILTLLTISAIIV
jgi:hypothetical protein